MLAMGDRRESPHGRRSATGGNRGAEAAQLFSAVMSAEIVERCVEVGGGRQHPQANQHRQRNAQASLYAMWNE